jgi:hypothetical protein
MTSHKVALVPDDCILTFGYPQQMPLRAARARTIGHEHRSQRRVGRTMLGGFVRDPVDCEDPYVTDTNRIMKAGQVNFLIVP